MTSTATMFNASHITVETALGAIDRAVTATGATLPAAVVAARDRATNLPATLSRAIAERDGLAAALLDVLDAGRDVLTDNKIRRMVTATGLHPARAYEGVEAALARTLSQTLRDHVDDVINAFRPAFDAAADTLVNARELLGDLDLNDAPAILRRGGAAAEAWAAAGGAIETLNRIDLAVTLLGLSTGQDIADPASRPLRIADLDLTQLEKHGAAADPWTLVRAGIALDLATVNAFRARRDAIAAARQARTQAHTADRDRRGSASRPGPHETAVAGVNALRAWP